MKIIKFPGQAITTAPSSDLRLLIGPVGFTCPACGARSEFEITNAIFKSIEFYCHGKVADARCGRPYRVINPAFNSPTSPNGPKRS